MQRLCNIVCGTSASLLRLFASAGLRFVAPVLQCAAPVRFLDTAFFDFEPAIWPICGNFVDSENGFPSSYRRGRPLYGALPGLMYLLALAPQEKMLAPRDKERFGQELDLDRERSFASSDAAFIFAA